MTAPAARPNLGLGILGALGGAVVGAIAWAVLVSTTDYKIGFAAVGVGALTGYAAGRLGGGHPMLPLLAAAIGLLGCVLGDLLIDAHAISVIAKEHGSSLSTLTAFRKMLVHPSDLGWPLYKAGFEAMDALFYAIAGVAAFRLATAHGLLHQHRAAQATQGAYAPPTAPPVAPPTAPPTALPVPEAEVPATEPDAVG